MWEMAPRTQAPWPRRAWARPSSASTASNSGSGLSTMPSPPPNGRSSTVRWRSCVNCAQILHAHVDQAGFARPADDAVVERPGEKFRKNGDDIEMLQMAKAADCRVAQRSASGRVQVAQPFGKRTSMRRAACRCACRFPRRAESAPRRAASRRQEARTPAGPP